MCFQIMGFGVTDRVLRQVRLNKTIKNEFTIQASAMDIELSELHDMAVLAFINDVNQSKDGATYLQQPKISAAKISNIRLSARVFGMVEQLANADGNSVSVPAVIYTGLMFWAKKHNFKTE